MDEATHFETWATNSAVHMQHGEAAQMPITGYGLLVAALGVFIGGIVLHTKNTEKRTTRLFYELNPVEQRKYDTSLDAFVHLSNSQRVWRVESRSATTDWKRNAGASTLINRAPVKVGSSTPPRVRANVAMPCIDAGSIKLFFLPDVILYLEGGVFGGIGYDDFQVGHRFTRFIEDGSVPSDGTIVDRTWRYVNKNGGPDRRFNNNAQLPVMKYGELLLTTSRGLNIHLDVSNAAESLAFADSWNPRPSANQSSKRQSSDSPTHPVGPEQAALKMLGLNSIASPTEISNAYRHLAQMYHPDKVAGLAPEFQALAEQRMKEINSAYEHLKHRTG